jgi:putative membrane protein
MLRDMINGFCMALADSVPGVSGGTVAFIMGFYDEFIGSIHDLVFRGMAEKKKALGYLVKLGIGWAVGMILAVLVLTSLFESHIYVVSSVFVGFIAGSIPLVIIEEKESFRKNIPSGVISLIAGAAVVVLVSWLNNGNASSSGMDLSVFSFTQAVKLFFIGMVAISAMFLPGISGSTLLLVFGAYIPVMTALRKVLSLELSYVPCLVFFVLGIVAGAVSVVKIIKFCLDRFHSQTMYAIVGMMIGSFYAIYLGPTTLTPARPALSLSSFSWIGCIAGVALVLVLQALKNKKSA